MQVTELEKVEAGAKANDPELRHIEAIAQGKSVRQGDIYIHAVSPDHEHGKKCGNQLAQGTTKGSRHVAEGVQCFEGTTAPDWAPRALLGPFIKAPKRFTVTHPEHAHFSLPAGNYQITHQMDARTLRRVQD